MATTVGTNVPILTSDGTPLKTALRRSMTADRRRAFALVAPLLAFLVVVFAVPIVLMIWRSVYNPEIRDYLPRTTAAISEWSGEMPPPERVYGALAADLTVGAEKKTLGLLAGRINREMPAAHGMLMRAASQAPQWLAPYREKFLAFDQKWGDPQFWQIVKRDARVITPFYYLLAFDYEYGPDGSVQERAKDFQIYQDLFIRTAWMSVIITVICLVAAYPVAYLLVTLPSRTANLLMILVLLPFWISLLVRTSAWIVLLQGQGLINDILVWVGVIDDAGRLRMIYNQMGTIVAMVHVLLPFMILPIYSVMKTISPTYLKAAKSLGAHPFRAWWRVYFPLTLPGLGAGCILVFILSIGFYITPALVGGSTGILVSNVIAQNMQGSVAQVKLAMSLSTILLVAVLLIYWIFNRLVGADKLKVG